jgi:deoxyribodipyrimidine photo-lyase
VPAAIVWFRQDLRIDDNPALTAAIAGGTPVIPVYLFDPEAEGKWPPGEMSRSWITESLVRLDESLKKRGSRLIVRCGPTIPTLRALATECHATALFTNRRFEPAARKIETGIERALRENGVRMTRTNASMLVEPDAIANSTGGPFRVFTPFHRAWLGRIPALDAPTAIRRIPSPMRWPRSDNMPGASAAASARLPAGGFSPGESGAHRKLRTFLRSAICGYDAIRDLPAEAGTSRLSPHLHFGEIGPRQVLMALRRNEEIDGSPGLVRASEAFLRQIAWREFAAHILHHHPRTSDRPLRPAFAGFPWARGGAALRAWQRGETGYPIVDAGMRELAATGWMHNRVRLIVASFLTKDLRISWVEGARWFWENLVDADLANNSLNWQWVAGCGADAAPYFRIFNPALQGARFDGRGDYVRRWIPEIAGLPDRWIHLPDRAPAPALASAGIRLGRDYPRPIVDHDKARLAALAAFETIKSR